MGFEAERCSYRDLMEDRAGRIAAIPSYRFQSGKWDLNLGVRVEKLFMKDDETEFTDTWKLRECITKYSDHISTPVELYEEKYEQPKEGEEKKEPEKKFEYTQINNAQALLTRTPKDVKDEEYNEFYKHLSHDYQDPLTWAHNKVEGDLEYTSLLYVPKMAPWDLYNRQNEHGPEIVP